MVTFDLWLACAIEEDMELQDSLPAALGKTLPIEEYDALLNRIARPSVARSAKRRLLEAYESVTEEIQSAPAEWRNVLLNFCSWLMLPISWT